MSTDEIPLRDIELPPPPYIGQEPFVFISYSHRDKEKVFNEIRRLKIMGCRLWYDQGIHAGHEWPNEIASALDRAAAFLLFLSPDAQNSKHVRDELFYALDSGKAIIAAELVPTTLLAGVKLRLSSTHILSQSFLNGKPMATEIGRALPPNIFQSQHRPVNSEYCGVVGVDFGTRNSVMAIWDGVVPVVIPSRYHQRSTPSVVSWDESAGWVVGEPAVARAERFPQDTVFSIKSLLGSDWRIARGGQTFSAVDLAALILREMHEDACQFLKSSELKAIATIPVSSKHGHRAATLTAFRQAGWNIVRDLCESTAAALPYCKSSMTKDYSSILVFDLGAGTFDATVVNFGGDSVEVLAARGRNDLGGDSFDQALATWCVQQLRLQYGANLELSEEDVRRITVSCESAKRGLSRLLNVNVYVPYLCNRTAKPLTLDIAVSLDQFKKITQHLTDEIINVCKEVVKTGICPRWHEDLGSIIVTGLGARIPGVRESLKEAFGIDAIIPLDPLECVGAGAAIQAAIYSGNSILDDIITIDALPHCLALELVSGGRAVLVHEHTIIPTTKSEIFHALHARLIGVNVIITEGVFESGTVGFSRGEERIGTVRFPADWVVADDEKFSIKIDVDVNRIVSVSVTSETSKKAVTEEFRRDKKNIHQSAVTGNLIEIHDEDAAV